MDTNVNGHDDDRGHEIIGPRVTVYDVYYYLVNGRAKEDILDILPITSEQFDRALIYIDEHRDQVERVHQKVEERNARGNPPEIRARLEESHQRFEAFKAQIRAAKSPEESHAGTPRGR